MERLLEIFRRFPAEVAGAVRRSVEARDRDALKSAVSAVPLYPPSRDLLMALVTVGEASDVLFVLKLLAHHSDAVEFWNVPRLASVLSMKCDRSLLPWLQSMAEKDEFWRYLREDKPEASLPVAEKENVYLFKRLAGTCLASVCGPEEWPLLKRLLFHDYWNIQVAAGKALVRFAGERELDEVLSELRKHPPKPDIHDLESGTMMAVCELDEIVYLRPQVVVGRP